jgi:hypothetical protein
MLAQVVGETFMEEPVQGGSVRVHRGAQVEAYGSKRGVKVGAVSAEASGSRRGDLGGHPVALGVCQSGKDGARAHGPAGTRKVQFQNLRQAAGNRCPE